MDALALTFSSGWASGINAYLVVLVLGIADRVGSFGEIPDVLARWDVLAVAGFLYAMEFIADKIPYIDSTWDAISTAIRPTAGAVIGVLLAGDASSLDQAVLGVVGRRHRAAEPPRQGGRTARHQLLPRAGEQRPRQPDRGRGRARRRVVRPRAPARPPRPIAGVLLLLGLVMLFFVARLVRRGWRRWKKKEPDPPDGLAPPALGFPRGSRRGGRWRLRRHGRRGAPRQARPRRHPARALGPPSAAP